VEPPVSELAAVDTRYRVRVAEGVADLPLADWSRVRGVTASLFMGAGFLATVERAFRGQASVRPVLVYDQHDTPHAWAAACTFPVDLTALAGPALQSTAATLRTVLPRLGLAKVLFVGFPVSLGQSHLAISPDARVEGVLTALDAALRDIAGRERAWLIVWKEFDPRTANRLDGPLTSLGYRRAESPAMHELDARFGDFSAYCAALTSHYRSDIRRSERKFRASGLRVVHLEDAEAIVRTYTAEVHRLYEAVVARSTTKLELLPVEFFHELVRLSPDLVTLTLVYQGDRIVAFNWGILDGRVYHYLFCGVDYSIVRDADIYFNLMYRQLDRALRSGAARIELGQTADVFKARLGCRPEPRYIYVKARHPVARAALRYAFPLLFPSRPAIPVYRVFRA
jgi:hypothetical protein